jgi:hypothetical protein
VAARCEELGVCVDDTGGFAQQTLERETESVVTRTTDWICTEDQMIEHSTSGAGSFVEGMASEVERRVGQFSDGQAETEPGSDTAGGRDVRGRRGTRHGRGAARGSLFGRA